MAQAESLLDSGIQSMKSMLYRISQWLDRLTTHRYFPILSGLTAFLLYLFIALCVLEPQTVWSPDEGAKLLQLKSLRLENGILNLRIIYTSQGMDPAFRYALINPVKDVLTVQDGALMLPRLPAFTLLSLLGYRLFSMYGLYILPALGGGITVWLTLALIHTTERRLAIMFLTALGSPIVIYAVLFWEHTLAAALGLAAAWFMGESYETIHHANRATRWILAAGSLALGTYLRLEVALFTLALLVAIFIYQPKYRSGVWLVGLMYSLFMLPYPFLHQVLFQNQALPLNARHLNLPLAYLGQTSWTAVQDLLIGPFSDEAIDSGWVGAVWAGSAILALGLSWLSFIWKRLQSWLIVPMAISLLPAFYFLLTSTPYRAAHGLLFTTPWALFGLTLIPELWRTNNLRLRTISLTVLLGLAGYTLIMLVFRASSPHGGLEWGARFALLFYPLLAIITAWGKVRPIREVLLLGLFILLGIGFQIRGLATIQHDKQVNHALNQSLVEASEVQVLSDLWWLPLNAAPIYPQKAFFLATSPETMAEWLSFAGRAGFQDFLLVTLDTTLPDQVTRALPGYQVQVQADEAIENLQRFHLQLTLR